MPGSQAQVGALVRGAKKLLEKEERWTIGRMAWIGIQASLSLVLALLECLLSPSGMQGGITGAWGRGAASGPAAGISQGDQQR